MNWVLRLNGLLAISIAIARGKNPRTKTTYMSVPEFNDLVENFS